MQQHFSYHSQKHNAKVKPRRNKQQYQSQDRSAQQHVSEQNIQSYLINQSSSQTPYQRWRQMRTSKLKQPLNGGVQQAVGGGPTSKRECKQIQTSSIVTNNSVSVRNRQQGEPTQQSSQDNTLNAYVNKNQLLNESAKKSNGSYQNQESTIGMPTQEGADSPTFKQLKAQMQVGNKGHNKNDLLIIENTLSKTQQGLNSNVVVQNQSNLKNSNFSKQKKSPEGGSSIYQVQGNKIKVAPYTQNNMILYEQQNKQIFKMQQDNRPQGDTFLNANKLVLQYNAQILQQQQNQSLKRRHSPPLLLNKSQPMRTQNSENSRELSEQSKPKELKIVQNESKSEEYEDLGDEEDEIKLHKDDVSPRKFEVQIKKNVNKKTSVTPIPAVLSTSKEKLKGESSIQVLNHGNMPQIQPAVVNF